MTNKERICPRCGADLKYDIATSHHVCVERCGYYD